jgi:hypothetical protein
MRKLSNDVTFLTKNTLNFIDNKGVDQGDHLRNRFQLGLAWRDFDQNKLDVLSKVEYFYENNETDLSSLSTRSVCHINLSIITLSASSHVRAVCGKMVSI